MDGVRGRRELLTAFTTTVLLAAAFAQPAGAAGGPATTGFDRATLAAMLATMPPSERASRAPNFLSGRPIVLYQRFFQEFGRDGWPVGAATLLSPTEVVPDSASRSGLYISVSADYEFVGGQASPYRWNIDGYWRWTPTADCCQTTADHVAIAWGGSLGLLNDYAYGYYTNGASIPTYRGHVSVNAGVEWYFSEWKQIDRATWKGASWGHILATIAEPHIQNYQSGVSLEYVHTYTTTAVSVSFGFPSPYITVSPADGNWPLSDYKPIMF